MNLNRIKKRAMRNGVMRLARERSSGLERTSAVVVAPHADDETLGCGGTILRKTRSGIPVHVVLVSDGSASHHDPIWPPQRLGVERCQEFIHACQRLGVAKTAIHWIGHEHDPISGHEVSLGARLSKILKKVQPDELYLPSLLEANADHRATWRIGLLAAEGHVGLTIFEYAVWFWHARFIRGLVRRLAFKPRLSDGAQRHDGSTVSAPCHPKPILVNVQDMLDAKRHALDAHLTQMKRPKDAQNSWKVLADVDNGLFLENCFQPYEFFLTNRSLLES